MTKEPEHKALTPKQLNTITLYVMWVFLILGTLTLAAACVGLFAWAQTW